MLSMCSSYMYRYFIVLVEGFNCFLANEDIGTVVNDRQANSSFFLLQSHGISGVQLSIVIINLGVKNVNSYLLNRKPVVYRCSNAILSPISSFLYFLS
jgi:hypothetical protein